MKQRELVLTIRYNDDRFEVDISESGGRGKACIHAPLDFTEHSDFDSLIGNEIYEWLALWKDTEK